MYIIRICKVNSIINSDKSNTFSVLSNLYWTDYSFVKPLRVIYQLTSYPSMTTMYTIFDSLVVTSCSAERCLSRVRTIKNHLRSTMRDDWFVSLTIFACERDIVLENLNIEDVMDRFASLSSALRRHPLCIKPKTTCSTVWFCIEWYITVIIIIASHEDGMNDTYNDKNVHVMKWCCEMSEEI